MADKRKKKSKNSKKRLIRRQYSGAEFNRMWRDWLTSNTSANAEIYGILGTLRDRCRDLARNDCYAGGAIRTILENVLGESGFTFQSKVPAIRGEGFNKPAILAIETLMKHWCDRDNCDVRGSQNFRQLARLVLRTWAESGEVLIRKYRQPFGNSKIPYAIKVLEPDYLCEDLLIQPRNSLSRVDMGIQLDEHDRVEGYWLYKAHPGDRHSRSVSRSEIEFVPKSELDHVFLCDRPGQIRGVPWLAIAIKRLHFLADTEDAELVAAKLAAMVCGFITTENIESFTDSMPEDPENCEESEKEPKVKSFEPGTYEHLNPGEKFEGHNPTRPNQALPDFTKHILRGLSAGIGLSYSAMSNDFSDASYSSHRAEKLKEIRATRFLQCELKDQFYNPQTKEVIAAGWFSDVLALPGYLQHEEKYLTFNWGCPGFDWIDPAKDIAAAVKAIEAGLSTITIELAKRNLDFYEIVEQRQHERQVLIDAGLIADPNQDSDEQLLEGISAVRSLLAGNSGDLQKIQQLLDKQGDREMLMGAIARLSQPPALPQATIEPSTDIEPPHQHSGITLIRGIVQRKKKCKKKPCGDTCIAMSKVCWVGLSAEQKKLALKARKAMKNGGEAVSNDLPPAVASNNSALDKAKIDPSLHNFYDFVKGSDKLSSEDEQVILEALGLTGQDGKGLKLWQQSKVGNLQADQLSYVESVAFEGYIGSSYRGMNEVLYNATGFQNGETNKNGFDFDQQMAINKAAASGLKKLPPVTEDQISQFKDITEYKPGDPMIRHESLSGEVLKQQIEKHKAAAQSGKPIIKEQFFSTTFDQDGLDHFSQGASIEYRIKAKTDGSGQGRLVDKYKNQAFESEILYPPMSGFKVIKVEELPATPAKKEITKTSTPASNKGKAKQIAVQQFDSVEYEGELVGSGFSKTAVAAKIVSKANMLSAMAKWTLDKKKKQDLTAQVAELKKISDSFKKMKGSKKSDLKAMGSKLKNELSKIKMVEVEVETIIAPAKPAAYIIEMEEI